MVAHMVKMPILRSVTDHPDKDEAILISANASGLRNGKTLKASGNKTVKRCEVLDTY